MRYNNIYDSIISRATDRKKLKKDADGYIYYENHHIVPRCLGGTNDKLNLVYLTAEEHWLCHLLLVKIYPGNNQLVFACQAMTMAGGNNKRMTNKLFGSFRRAYSEATSLRQKGKVISQAQRDKTSATLKGRPALHQIGDNNVSKRLDVAKKISIANKGRKSGPCSEETKNKISIANKGHAGANKEANGSFSGYIIATPKNGGPEIRMGGRKEIESFGFTYTSVRACMRREKKSHKGYLFRKE